MIQGFTPPNIPAGADPATPVLVAFSGGADSSVLLHLIKKHYSGDVFAAHVNHMIRGEEADRDEEFCRQVCRALDVPLFVLRKDIPAYAQELGASVETAARRARYDFFDELMEKHNIPLLATAHNANDNLETLIFNITRGTGLGGVCGIPEVRKCKGGTVVRPILGMSRTQVLEYCAKNNISYVTDSTNTDTDYTRNKIRATVIPALTQINPSAVQNAARMSASLREDELCLSGLADWFCEEMNEDASFDIQKFLGSPAAIANRALMSLYSSMTEGQSLEYVHVQAVRTLCKTARPHSKINLPHGIDAVIENGALHLMPATAAQTAPEEYCLELSEGKNLISQINAEIIIGNSQNAKNIYKTAIPMYLDFDKICGTLNVRNRRPSDKIKLRGMNRSIKKLLCDLHIPQNIRCRLPMICDGDTVVAIPQVGVADGYALPRSSQASMTFSLL